MRNDEDLKQQSRQANESWIDAAVQGFVGLADPIELDQTQQPQNTDQPDGTQQVACDKHREDRIKWHRGKEISPEPELEVVLGDLAVLVDQLFCLEVQVRCVEVKANIHRKTCRNEQFNVIFLLCGRYLKANVIRDEDDRVDDQHAQPDIPEDLERVVRVEGPIVNRLHADQHR